MKHLTPEGKKLALAAMGVRRYQFKPFTSKNIGRKRKSGKNYNQPYRPEARLNPETDEAASLDEARYMAISEDRP